MRLAITAGFDRSPAAIALAELLTRAGHQIGCVIVVTPWSVKRVRSLIAQRGLSVLKSGLRKLTTGSAHGGSGDPMSAFLEQEKITERSLRAWCRKHNVRLVSVQDINSPQTIAELDAAAVDAVIYGGGGILRKPFIDAAGRRVINPHCGPLPEIRGMNAIEWAVLLDQEPAITVHYIDEGIDTGAIIQRVNMTLIPREQVAALRARAVVTGVRQIVAQLSSANGIEVVPSDIASHPGRQCYTMSTALQELLQHRLDRL